MNDTHHDCFMWTLNGFEANLMVDFIRATSWQLRHSLLDADAGRRLCTLGSNKNVTLVMVADWVKLGSHWRPDQRFDQARSSDRGLVWLARQWSGTRGGPPCLASVRLPTRKFLACHKNSSSDREAKRSRSDREAIKYWSNRDLVWSGKSSLLDHFPINVIPIRSNQDQLDRYPIATRPYTIETVLLPEAGAPLLNCGRYAVKKLSKHINIHSEEVSV